MADEQEIAPVDLPEEEDEGGPVKTFLEHLEDLRWVFIKCATALGVSLVVCLVAMPVLISVLTLPLAKSGADVELQLFGPIGGVMVTMRIALYGGMVLAIPFILYFIGEFVMPALKKEEKKYFMRAFVVGAGLFMAGVMLCYFFVLQIALYGMTQYNKWLNLPTEYWRAEEYFSFVTMFMVGMGLSFEIPVILLTLVRMGLVPHEWLTKGRPYFFVINYGLCAFITPDFISTFFMVIPVQLLLEGCILISKYWERQKRAEEAALAASEAKGLQP
jgi:sec-independent protein translocase protein TatC